MTDKDHERLRTEVAKAIFPSVDHPSDHHLAAADRAIAMYEKIEGEILIQQRMADHHLRF